MKRTSYDGLKGYFNKHVSIFPLWYYTVGNSIYRIHSILNNKCQPVIQLIKEVERFSYYNELKNNNSLKQLIPTEDAIKIVEGAYKEWLEEEDLVRREERKE